MGPVNEVRAVPRLAAVPSLDRQRILVIDDDPNVSEVVAAYLAREGALVEVRHDGASGLEAALADPPDLVVLDLMLPEIDGLEVCRRLHALAPVPIVMLTAKSDETERIIGLVGLGAVADKEVSEIPTGTARVVELGRALMTRPKVLLLDEPASGQTEEETEAFGRLLVKLAKEDGLAILLVEHDMALVMEVCDYLHVLDFGRIIAHGVPAEIRTNQAVLDAYLGSEEGA